MKILYIHRTQGEEPESIHILSIVNALRELGHEVEIFGPSKKDMSTAGSNVKLLSAIKRYFPKFVFEILQILYNLVTLIKLNTCLESYKPDFVYERYALYSFAGVLLCSKKHIPLILEVNTPYAHAWNKYYKLNFPELAKRVEKYILSKADRIITVTETQKAFLTTHYVDESKISVAQNAINIKEFNPDIKPVDIAWSIEQPVVIGFVGTMNRWQGIPALIDVIPDVLTSQPTAVFLLVGDGEFRQQLEEHVRKTGYTDRVRFTGKVAHKNVPNYINAMDITILPDSNTYGSPMKIFEYMAMKKAIIAPDVEPVREIMAHNSTGLIIDRSHAFQLSTAIKDLVTNKSKRDLLSENALEYVVLNHTWTENAKKILAVYDDIKVERTTNAI
jgi:glycosyltransferase involved in cell wall biosynthesis